jgi:lipopolysaccharide biosynthesis protein
MIEKIKSSQFFNAFFPEESRQRNILARIYSKFQKQRKRSGHSNRLFNEMFSAQSVSEEYVPYKQNRVETDIRAIAFYLPQFHPIPENDQWWGKGFTEWHNIAKAIPQFEGHYQPRLPDALGYYDLRVIDVSKAQIELAKNFGIHGFCYYYYWFNEKKLLEMPIYRLLAHPELNFPFCICWANENWTRAWDGSENKMLIEQKYSPEDDIRFIEEMFVFFKDSRYIRINDRPLLIIYRPLLFPDIKSTIGMWREHCRKSGVGEIYVVSVHSLDMTNPEEIGLDAAVEFPPNRMRTDLSEKTYRMYNPNFRGKIHEYDFLIERSKSFKRPDYKKFRGICPSWDNEARRPGAGSVFQGSTPEKYGAWLKEICNYTTNNFSTDEKIIFINAWNEWAEGTYLEPDRKYGYSYLQTTADVLNGR